MHCSEHNPTIQYNCVTIQPKVLCVLQVQMTSSELHNFRVGFKQEDKHDCLLLLLLAHMLVIHIGENATYQPGNLTSNTSCNCNVTLTKKYQCNILRGGLPISGFKSMQVDFYAAMTQTETCGRPEGRETYSAM